LFSYSGEKSDDALGKPFPAAEVGDELGGERKRAPESEATRDPCTIVVRTDTNRSKIFRPCEGKCV
jgi:hypothetical protein